MAISKQKDLANGAVGSYWKVTRVILDKIATTCHATMILYMDQEKADSGNDLGVAKHFSFPLKGKDPSGDILAFAYGLIKDSVNNPESLDPDLSGGSDV